jgi:hypothetical protein
LPTAAEHLAELNAVRVSMQDLIRASGEISKLRPEHRGWEVRINLMFRLFPNELSKGRQ